MFPERSKYFKLPIGWEDLGKMVGPESQYHSFCGRDVRIGREEGDLFHYCRNCSFKVDVYKVK